VRGRIPLGGPSPRKSNPMNGGRPARPQCSKRSGPEGACDVNAGKKDILRFESGKGAQSGLGVRATSGAKKGSLAYKSFLAQYTTLVVSGCDAL
jgi:hypothetical protein